jgi:hypothetical protein
VGHPSSRGRPDLTEATDLAAPADEAQHEVGRDHTGPDQARARDARWVETACAAACGVLVVLVSLYRLGVARTARYPGHADPAFYYGVAQNIHRGLGPKIDYIWEFLSGQPPLPRYAFDYWLPLPSVLMSLVLHNRDSLSAVLALNVAMSVLLAIGTYLLARGLTDSGWVPAAATAATLVQPAVAKFTMQTEGSIYLAAFAVLAMAATVRARRHPWLWPVAGVLAALANLSRNEGLLLIILVVVGVLASEAGRARIIWTAATVLGYLAVMSPLYYEDERYFRTLLPPATGNFPYITEFEDLFSVHVDRSLSSLMGGSLWEFFRLRLDAVENVVGTFAAISAVIVLMLIGTTVSRLSPAAPARTWWSRPLSEQWWFRAARSPWFVPVSFVGLAFLLYTAVAPAVSSAGAALKGMVTIIPVLIVCALVPLARRRPSTIVISLLVLALIGEPMRTLATTTRFVVRTNNEVGIRAAAIAPEFAREQSCLGRPVVLMTRQPWEITQATGVRTVMIPNGTLSDILTVAARYGVTDIQYSLQRSESLYPAITQAASGTGPLVRTRSFKKLRLIFRIRAASNSTSC